MPTIARVKWPAMKLDYGWLFKITNFVEFTDYWQKIRITRLQEGFSNYLKSREFHEMVGESKNFHNHLTNDDAQLIHCGAMIETQKDKPGSVVDALARTSDAVCKGMLRVLGEQGHIYVNGVGGYMFLSSGLEETETKEVPEYVLPKDRIRIKQWPDGKHYYAYVGNVSVEMDGTNKWSTEAMAQIKAEQWAKQNNVSFEEEE